MKKNKLEHILSFRAEQGTKAAIKRLAELSRRNQSNYMRIILSDVIKNKVKL